jgi:hypothetical protein
MYKPALMIGLGGTGQLTLRHLKAELLGSETRQMPQQIKLIALDTVQDDRRSDDQKTKLAALRTELDPGEYFWIGGNVYDYTREVAHGQHPHVASWYQANTYLKILPPAAFTLQRGAGQLRQFGRLAVFKDVQAPAMSNIRQLIDMAITEIRGAGFIPGLDVFLVSSVVGGTGAGMFVDLAYLIRQIAKYSHNNLSVTLRGFLVLPEVFSAIPGGVKDSMRARAFAAMRENKRFMIDFDWATGYPMYYHAQGSGGIWHSEMHTKLFDFLYHIDGQRANNPLTNVLPEFGVTPTIADAIAAMLDKPVDSAEDRYAQHGANVIVQAGQEQNQIGGTAFDATLGTYTISLPMHYLLEGLGYQLALQAMEAFLAPSNKDEDGYPTDLAPDQNLEIGEGTRGRDNAIHFLQASEVQAWQGEEKVANTLLLKEVLRIATRYSPQNTNLVQKLALREVKGWEIHLDPPGSSAEVVAVRERVRKELDSQLTTSIQPRNRTEKPQDVQARITPHVERYKGLHLGRENTRTGQRVGGQYRQALDEYATIHQERFRLMLRLETINILNGSEGGSQLEYKKGKLGYLLDFYYGIERILGLSLKAINEAKELREARQIRQRAVSNVQIKRRDMEREPENWLDKLGWAKKAFRSQDDYLKAEQQLIDVTKVEIITDTVRGIVSNMIAHVADLRANAENWSRVLGIGYDSLYSMLLRGQRQVNEMIHAEDQVKVRQIVWNQDYQNQLMNKYAVELTNGLENVLESLNWHYHHRRMGDHDVHELRLVVNLPERDRDEATMRLENQAHNLELALAPCRQIFGGAWQQESILKYLMNTYPRPEDLAGELVANSGPLLSISGGKPVPANYLHVAFGNDNREREYLDRVRAQLTKLSGASGKLNDVVNSADRFSCRLVYTLDLIPLHEINSYRAGLQPYRAYTETVGDGQMPGKLGRETLHIFPAEVYAAGLESRLGEINHPPREFHNDVVLQLENIEEFRLFVRCWAYEVVSRNREDRSGTYYHYYGLNLSDEDGTDIFGHKRESKFYLTLPDPAPPSVFDALKTFNYVRQDVRPDFQQRLDYGQVKVALEKARRRKVKELVEKGVQIESPIRELLQDPSLPQADQERVKVLLAERAHLKQMQQALEPDLAEEKSGQRVSVRLRDVSTIFYLTLQDDIRSVEEAVRQILEASRGLG